MRDIRQLLIIRPGAIGDTLLTMPLLQTMRRFCPGLSIHFVGNPLVLPLLHACNLIEESSNYDDAQWSYLFIPPSASPRRASQAYERLQQELQQCDAVIAWLRDETGAVADNLHRQRIPHSIIAASRPAAHNQQHITNYLAHTLAQDWPAWNGWSAQTTWQPPTRYSWQPLAPRHAAHNQPTIAIHPGSGSAQKCWPVSAFAQLIRMLWQRQVRVLLLGGPADEERIQQLQHLLARPLAPSFLRLVLSSPLPYITQELQRCQGYIGNDTGITHLAALLGLPTIALFGPSDPITWHPIGPRVTLLHEPTLADLSPLTVYENIALS